MDVFVLRIFQMEIEQQCRFVLLAAAQLEQAIQQPSSTMHTSVWYSLQALLTSAANLSKMLWGSGGRLAEGRSVLRESLGVKSNSVLQDTDLRNDFEHFDTRLEDWFATDEHRNYAGRNIGPPGMLGGSAAPKKRFHWFDPSTGIVSFWDHAVQLVDVVQEVKELLQRAEVEVHKMIRAPGD